MSDNFVRITVPKELVEKIDELIKKSGGRYKTRAEVAREALARFLEETESNP